MNPIPPFRYSFTADDAELAAEEVRRLLVDGAFLTLGQWTQQFEQTFGAAHRASHSVAVSSGTAALEILLRASVVSGKRVIAPSNTFGATLVAIERAGATPLLAECEDDFSLSARAVEAILRERRDVAAVVVVHLGGAISRSVIEIAGICARHGVALVEDAAHATGASLDGRFAGAFGIGAAFSFFSTKVLTSGEGGMILTEDASVAARARLLRDHAKRADGAMDVTGYNWRLTEIQALLATLQTRRLGEIIAGRERVAAGYERALAGIEGIDVVTPPTGCRPNYYKVIVRIPPGLRTVIRRRMLDEFAVSMGGEIYAIPCHLQRAFSGLAEAPLPKTEALCAGHVCPPIFPDMSEAELDHAAGALARVLREERGKSARASG